MKVYHASIVILASLFMFSPTPGLAQQCGIDIIREIEHQKHPEIRLRQKAIDENQARSISYESEKSTAVTGGGSGPLPVLTFPAVVHIVHLNGPENVDDNTVIGMIDEINQRLRNSGAFEDADGVDTFIEVCLATRDPEGNPTTGILRHESTFTDWDVGSGYPTAIEQWDPTQYMNIYILKSITAFGVIQINGVGSFPSNHGGINDALLLRYDILNTEVPTHEVGHNLNLYHTFQDGCPNDDCLASGDMVCDTPPDDSSANPPSDCTENSCSTDADDPASYNPFNSDVDDQTANYLDYGNCRSLFTEGQRRRMRAALLGPRSSWLNSDGCYDGPCPLNFLDLEQDYFHICPDEDITLQASGAATYWWQPPWWFWPDPSNPTQTLQPPFDMSVEVWGNDGNSCWDVTEANIIVDPFACGPDAFCTQTGTQNSAPIYVRQFGLGNLLDLPPLPIPDMYQDRMFKSADLAIGETYNLLTFFQVNTNGGRMKIKIDNNRNGIFDGPGDHIFSFGIGAGTPGLRAGQTSITIDPQYATPGPTRLRVHYSEMPNAGPCDEVPLGHIIDYRVNLHDCSVNPLEVWVCILKAPSVCVPVKKHR